MMAEGPSNPFVSKLTIHDHALIYEKLLKAREQWWDIGLKLGVSNNTLKSINTSEPNDSKRYLCNMLEHCLKSRENLTWKELCECLQSPVVDCSHVAQEIEDWLCPNETEGSIRSIKRLQEKNNISDEQLHTPINEGDLFILAECFDNTDFYYELFGLSDGQKSDVKIMMGKAVENQTQIGMKQILKYWFRKERKAKTYCDLLSLVLSIGKKKVAVELCKKIPTVFRRKRQNPASNLERVATKYMKVDSSVADDSITASKESLEINVEEENWSIEKSFNKLSTQVKDSLENREIKPITVLSCLQGFDMVESILKSESEGENIFAQMKKTCRECQTISDLWTFIGDFFTSYSYEILEAIIENYGSDSDKKSLKEYETKFIEHSNNILKMHSGALAQFIKGSTKSKLIVKLNKSFKTISQCHMEQFKNNLAKALKIPEDYLMSFGIKAGCVQITYHVPLSVEFNTFPLSAEQLDTLRNLSVIWLKCGIYWYFLQSDDSVEAYSPSRRDDTDRDPTHPLEQFLAHQDHSRVAEDIMAIKGVVSNRTIGFDDKGSSSHGIDSGIDTMLSSKFRQTHQNQQKKKTEDLQHLTHTSKTVKSFPNAIKVKVDLSCSQQRLFNSTDYNTSLHTSCHTGELVKVKFCINVLGLNPLDHNGLGDTALHVAVKNGSLDIVRYLVEECKISPTCESKGGSTPLHIAALHNHVHLAQYLIHHQGDVLKCDKNKETPLSLACLSGNVKLVQNLFEEAQRVTPISHFINNTSLSGKTILHHAVLSENLNLLKYLLSTLDLEIDPSADSHETEQHGSTLSHAMLHKADENGCFPIHLACIQGSCDIVSYLVESKLSDVNICTKYSKLSLLHHAAFCEKTAHTTKYLVNSHNCNPQQTDVLGNTPLHYAAESGVLESVRFLVKDCGCNPSALNIQKLSPLHSACQNGHLDVVKFLIEEQKCDASSRDVFEETPLHYAAYSGNLDIVKYLVTDQHCDPRAQSSNGQTPLCVASYGGKMLPHLVGEDYFKHRKFPPKYIEIIKFLVEEQNCSPITHYLDSLSPLQLAVCHDNMRALRYFIESRKCDVSLSLTSDGASLLHLAAINNSINSFNYLIENHQFNIMCKDQFGNTPLHYAALISNMKNAEALQKEHYKTVLQICPDSLKAQKADIDRLVKGMDLSFTDDVPDTAIIQYLLNKLDCLPELINDNNQTPLHIACRKGLINIVKLLGNFFDFSDRDSNGSTLLHIAAENGCLHLIEYLVNEHGFDVMCVNKIGATPIHLAVLSGHLDVVKYFVEEKNYDVDGDESAGRMLIHSACQKNRTDVVKYLAGDCQCKLMITDENGRLPLHHAVIGESIEITQYLIDVHGDHQVKAKDVLGFVPLHYAAVLGNMDITRYLVEEGGSDLMPKDLASAVPLHYAASSGNLDLVKYLAGFENVDVMCKDDRGNTPLHAAAENGCLDIVKYFISGHHCNKNIRNLDCQSPLHLAATNGHIDVVEYLAIEEKMWITSYSESNQYSLTDEVGLTPAHLAACFGHLELVKFFVKQLEFDISSARKNGILIVHCASMNGKLPILQFLVELGCVVSVKDSEGRTPLHYAATFGSPEVVEYLIERCGCEVEAEDVNGRISLHYAAINETDFNTDVVKCLVEKYKCDVMTPDKEGKTALHHAASAKNLELVRYLVDRGVDPMVKDKNGCIPLHLAAESGCLDIIKELASEQNMNIKTNAGDTPLHCAALEGHLDTVQYLVLDLKCDTSIVNGLGFTPVHMAVLAGCLDVIKFFVQIMKINILEDRGILNEYLPIHTACFGQNLDVLIYLVEECGFDPMSKDKTLGRTPIHLAAQCGNIEFVVYLTSKASDPMPKDEMDCTPLHLAAERGNLKVVQYLVSYLRYDVNAKNKENETPLDCAAKFRQLSVLRYLWKNQTSESPDKGIFAVVSYNRDIMLHEAIQSMTNEDIDWLIFSQHCDLTAADIDGNTCLHVATQLGRLELVEQFVDAHKLDINQPNYQGFTPLHLSASNGQRDIAKFLLDKSHCDTQYRDNDNRTALHHAVMAESLDVVQLFLEDKRFDVNVKDGAGRNVLHIAAESYEFDSNQKIVPELLAFNADTTAVNSFNQTPLHVACSKGNNLLVDTFVNCLSPYSVPDEADCSGATPLHYAALNGSVKIVKSLLSHGYNPNQKDHNGNTALHYAAIQGNVDAFKYLVYDFQCDPNCVNQNGLTPAHAACSLPCSNNIIPSHLREFVKATEADVHSIIDLLGSEMIALNQNLKTYDTGEDLLHYASRSGYLRIIEYLINKMKFNPHSVNNLGQTPLHIASLSRKTDIAVVIMNQDFHPPLVSDHCGATPLHYAALGGDLGIVCLLTASGYNPICKDHNGNTALHYAAINGKVDILRHLITRKKCDPNIVNSYTLTPAGAACLKTSLELLPDHLQVFITATEKERLSVIALLSLDLDVLSQTFETDKGEDLFHLAARSGYSSIVSFLLYELKLDHRTVNCFSETPLHTASINGHKEVVAAFLTSIDGPLSLSLDQDCGGATPLHHAALCGNLNIVRMLVSYGYKAINRDNHGNTVMHYAATNGNNDILRYLIFEADGNPNCTNENGFTVAHTACSRPTIAIHLHSFVTATEADLLATIQFLRNEIIDITQIPATNSGNNLLHIAAQSGYLCIVQYLTNELKFDPQQSNQYGCKPLDIAMVYQNPETVDFLKEHTQDIDTCPSIIHLSALLGYTSSLQHYLNDLQYDADSYDSIGRTPLHYAAMGGHLVIAQYLISFEANPLSEDLIHNLPLHYAAALGHLEVVQFLVNIGSPLTTKGVLDKTVAEMAASGGHKEVMDYLISLPGSSNQDQKDLTITIPSLD